MLVAAGVVMGSQIAVVVMFTMGVASAGKKSSSFLDNLKEKAIKIGKEATMDGLHERLQDGLNKIQIYVQQMIDDEEMEPDIGEVSIVLLEECHNMDLAEKKSIVQDLTTAMSTGLTNFTEHVFDFAVSLLTENARIMATLIKIVVKRTRKFLIEVGTAPLFVDLVTSAIKTAPRIARSFDTIKIKLEKVARQTLCCQSSNDESDSGVLPILTEMCFEICGGQRGLQRITDQAFKRVRDECEELGVPEVGLCLLKPIGTAAVNNLFEELKWHSLDPIEAEDPKSDKKRVENHVDYCSVMFKLSALTTGKLEDIALQAVDEAVSEAVSSVVEIEMKDMVVVRNMINDPHQIPSTFYEAQQLATGIIAKEGMDRFKQLTGLTAVPQTEDEFTAMCATMAVQIASEVSDAIGLTEIAGELWSAAFDLLVPCLLNLNQPAQN